jgi:hypothetical protein
MMLVKWYRLFLCMVLCALNIATLAFGQVYQSCSVCVDGSTPIFGFRYVLGLVLILAMVCRSDNMLIVFPQVIIYF